MTLEVKSNQAFSAEAMTGDAQSDVFDMLYFTQGSAHIFWDAAVGTGGVVTLQGSNKEDGSDPGDLDGVTTVTIDAATGEKLIQFDCSFRFLTVDFEQNTQTSGNLNVIITGKTPIDD